MQINESYYGQNVQYKHTHIYTPSYIANDRNLFYGYNNVNSIITGGDLIDKSVTFGEFGDGANFKNVHLVKYDSATDTLYNHSQHIDTVPFFMSLNTSTYDLTSTANYSMVFHGKMSATDSTCYGWTQLPPRPLRTGYGVQVTGDAVINPILKYDLRTAMYVIVIHAYDNNNVDYVCDLWTYVHSAKYILYPNVKCISAVLFFVDDIDVAGSNATWGTGTNVGAGLGTNIRIDVPSDVQQTTFEKCTLIRLSHWYNPSYVKYNTYHINDYYSMPAGIMLGGHVANNLTQYITNSNNLADSCFMYVSDDFDVVKRGNNYTTHFNKYAINDDTITSFYNYCMRQCAFLGGYFTDNMSAIFPYNASHVYNPNVLSSSDVCLAVWDGGTTTGNYTRGVDNIDNDAYNWTDVHDNNYKPSVNDDDIGDFISHWHSADIVGTTNYGLTQYQMIQFMKWISSINSTQVAQDFKGKNPVDYIITAMYTPYKILKHSDQSQTNLTLTGNNAKYPHDAPLHPDENIQCYELVDMYDINVASFDISRSYYDFRDFAPYTTATLSIPFCNTIDIDVAFFYGHKLNVKMSFDCRTGNCTAYILRDSLCVQTVHGTFAVPVVFNAIAQGSYQNALKQNQISFSNSFINAAVGIGSNLMQSPSISSIGNIATAINDVSSSYYQLTHTAPPPQRVGTIGDLNNFAPDTRCNLLIKHYKTLNINDDIYSDTVGHACIKTGKISDFSGYIQCGDIKLTNCHLTANEQNQIKNLLCSGVYV